MSLIRLKEVLREKGISGKELAERVGVTENAISMISNNKRQPRFELLAEIAETLNVDVKELFHSTKEDENETLFVLRDGKYVPIGQLKKEG